jgi:threonine dehydratase
MVTISDINRARETIRQHVTSTPLIYSDSLSHLTGAEIYLKCENLQKTGSFKVRGAFNKLTSLNSPKVIAASTGNHAQGVAYAAATLGIKSRIVMPMGASVSKESAVKSYGGEVLLHGETLSEALEYANSQKDCTFIHTFDDDQVIAGQGTIALEVLDQLDNIDYVLVPVGGGGLISGISIAFKSLSPDSEIIGVQSEASMSAMMSLGKQVIVEMVPGHTLADGIAVGRVGERNFKIINRYVDGIESVDEEAIAEAILLFMERKKLVVEGAGAVPLALIKRDKERFRGKRVVLVVSGGNIDFTIMDRIILRGLLRNGRVGVFNVTLDDVPGALNKITNIIAARRGNIIGILHNRLSEELPFGKTNVRLTIESRGEEHLGEIMSDIRAAGIKVEL